MAMSGMLCGVAAVIFDVVVNMAKLLFQQKRILPVLVLLVSFAAVRFFELNMIIVLLICGMIGALETWQPENPLREVKEK